MNYNRNQVQIRRIVICKVMGERFKAMLRYEVIPAAEKFFIIGNS
jgi:hypothetical protein